MKLKFNFLLLLILICGQKLYSQNREIDSVYKLIKLKHHDTVYSELYIQLSE